MNRVLRRLLPALSVSTAIAAILFSFAALAEDPAPSPELAERMAKEKDARKACKIEICQAFATPAAGAPITCTVTKTWLAAQIQTRILGDRLTWPWGHAQCTTAIELDRAQIMQAASQPSATLKLKKHNIACQLESKDEKEAAYEVKLSIEPTVTFEAGKAVKVNMGWGQIEAPILAKTAIWSATAVDANFSVIANGVAREINTFLYESCKEVGVEIAAR